MSFSLFIGLRCVLLIRVMLVCCWFSSSFNSLVFLGDILLVFFCVCVFCVVCFLVCLLWLLES